MHPFPSLLVAAVTAALLPFADRDAGVALYLQLGLGMLLYQFAIGAANDVVDAPDDQLAKPSKPIPSGRVTPRAASLIAAGCIFGGLAVTLPMDLIPWFIGMAALACGLVYDFWLKRTPLSWLPLSVALPIVPVWVFTAAGAWDHLLWWTFPAGVLLGAALHFANELPDIHPTAKSRGLVHLAGKRRSYILAMSTFGAGTSVATVVLALTAPVQGILSAVTSVLAFSIAPRATRFFGRNGLFGLFAMTIAIVSIVFISAAA